MNDLFLSLLERDLKKYKEWIVFDKEIYRLFDLIAQNLFLKKRKRKTFSGFLQDKKISILTELFQTGILLHSAEVSKETSFF